MESSQHTYAFVIDYDDLRPLEQLIVDAENGGYNSAEIVNAAIDQGIVLSEHPAYDLIKHHKNYVCLHKTHVSDEAKQSCIDSQIGKEMVKCIRVHISNLQYRKHVRDDWDKQYVYWNCTDTKPCRDRIGKIESTDKLEIEVLHPECSCKMRYVTQDKTGNAELLTFLEYIESDDKNLAGVFRKNVASSGWKLDESGYDPDFDEEDVIDPSDFWDATIESVSNMHEIPAQKTRQKRAASVALTDITEYGGEYQAECKNYTVCLDYCDCKDYTDRDLPCKHMYRLAHEAGKFELDMPRTAAVNYLPIKEPVKPADHEAHVHRHGAICLAILFGCFGTHLFYQRKPYAGLLFAAFCWTFIPGIIALVHAIVYGCSSDQRWRETCMPGGSSYGLDIREWMVPKWDNLKMSEQRSWKIVYWAVVASGPIYWINLKCF